MVATGVEYRPAGVADLPAIVALLADDPFGAARNPAFEASREAYETAFAAMVGNPDNHMVVAVEGGAVIGCYQLTYIRGLSYTGGLRAQIESVRIASDRRGRGLGDAMMRDAIGRARTRGCVLVQLTTDVRRERTRRFYERLGFAASHHGMKLFLTP
jgi:ribosomal protein S18 acetylase RimI-like enzyme